MTYLQLINNVLVRLRESEITLEEFNAGNNPYWKLIGSTVNDAKDRVEDAWQWGALRGTDKVILQASNASNLNPQGIQQNYYEGNTVALPNSVDSHYMIKRIYSFPVKDNGSGVSIQDGSQAVSNMSWITTDSMYSRYQIPEPSITGRPTQYAITGETSGPRPAGGNNLDLEGSLELTIWPPVPNNTWGIGMDRVSHQPPLVNASDKILVPPLPVYTLATALASRERGEVGGAPTSELFVTADRHLSDAIAQDSTLYANELNWYANDQDYNTNVRFA